MTRITNQSKSCEGLTKDSCTIFCVARWDCRAACQNVSTRCHLLKDFEWEDLVSNKNREILRSVLSFKTRKLLSNQHFGRPTLQKLRQCPLDLSSARSLLGPTPSPNFHKIPDRWATSFNELQRVRIGSPSHPITGSLPQPPNTALVKSAVAALVRCQWSWRTVASLRFAAGGRVGQFGCFDSTGWSCRDHLPRPLIVCQFAWRWRQYIILLYKH